MAEADLALPHLLNTSHAVVLLRAAAQESACHCSIEAKVEHGSIHNHMGATLARAPECKAGVHIQMAGNRELQLRREGDEWHPRRHASRTGTGTGTERLRSVC